VVRKDFATKGEDAPVKGLYALAFLLSSFAANAHSPNSTTIALFELDDYFGEVTDLSLPAPQALAAEPMIGAIQPRDQGAVIQFAVWWDDKLSFEDTAEPTRVPAEITAPPTIES
jgi:hypothetical protein